MALGGTMASSGYDSVPGAPPIAPTGGNAYHTACHIGTSAMLVALIHAKRTGKGQFIDMAVHDATSVTTEIAFFDWAYDKKIVKRYSGRHAGSQASMPTNLLTKDGKRINLMLMPLTQATWEGFVAWMNETGEAEDLTDEKFKDFKVARLNMPHVMGVLTRFCLNHSLEELYHRGQKLRFAWSPIMSVDEVPTHPHWQDRQDMVEVEYPESGRSYTHLTGPYKFSRSHWEIRGRAPLLGEHNEDVLVGELGFAKDRLTALAEAGVI
jgi:crotonobetainyl-CoA:carnitine CoA-transferase CaiB-like acyl-CoA transferase